VVTNKQKNKIYNMKNSDSLKVVAALLAGAVAGTVLGLLFAPVKGADLRKKAVDGAKELADNLKKKMNNQDAKEHIKELTGS
jgi:gas vesicle protein